MSIFKRTFTSLYACIDQMVGEIENHDALIQAAINEQRKKIAGARVQLRKVQANEKRVREQVAQLRLNEKLWTQRALKEAETNEAQALACLQRRQKNQQQLQKLTTMQQEYEQAADRMQADIARCEADLESMVQKHQILRARQSTADAMQAINHIGSPIDQVENSFDRWEVQVAQGELTVDRYDDVDELERDYLSQENEQALRQELAELLKESKLSGGDDE